jgi:sn-glycerol 3-phosphate transport system ATP-binding protein
MERKEKQRAAMNKLELHGIVKSFDGRTNVLNHIDFDVQEGEFFVLVGPSGCGKSTLLRIIAGLESITEGTIRIDGKEANQLLPRDRHISMVFQNYALYPHMTVKDNILFGLDVRGVPKEEQMRRLAETAEMTGLQNLLDRKPRQLSGGQRQRTALARCICSQEPICLMDEPLSNLDAKLRAQMRSDIRRLQKQLGLTVVYVTHDQVEAMTMGDRIMVINEGIVQQIGTPLTLYNQPCNQFVSQFIGSPQMNILSARLSGSELILDGGMHLALTPAQLHHLPEGTHWNVGIRPEHIFRGRPGSPDAAAIRPDSVEMMGNETQITFRIQNTPVTARWQGQISPGPDGLVTIALNADFFHFFDPENGRACRNLCAPLNAAQTALPKEEPETQESYAYAS